ncbi:hypothetical protein FNH05_00880 [Amycolatopsis rhizosphaerae]|uniref:Proteinase inhibitor I42 chagasin domain-containing protein n=1 Tax=Amycolatopsis rhizosphaerae TaxID=2053003 RepID=A0A558DNA2_9PSEU|nr:hypothetical protein [Amycolatopsis rhizosphaerae]TVT62477.1 hypothetical protein FNH05_00880 [Amycolatopsis rhizosphaerae]
MMAAFVGLLLTAATAACGTRSAPAGSLTPQTGTEPPGVVVTFPGGPSPTATTPKIVHNPRALTVSDRGVVVEVRVGQSFTVSLGSPGDSSWQLPTVTGDAVTRVSTSGGYPAGGPAQATFLATRPGAATLTAGTDIACRHATPPCEVAQQQWQVTVTVI